MASSYEKPTAEQVRSEYREKYFKADPEVYAPKIVDAIADDVDGLMPITKIDAPIKVEIQEWTGRLAFEDVGDPRDKLFLEWRRNASENWVVLSEEEIPGENIFPSSEFPLEREIPLDIFEARDITFQYRCRVRFWNNSFELDASAPVTVDRTGPIRPGVPQAMDVPVLVTTESLDRDDGIICTVPDFIEDKKESVKIAVGWSDTIPENEEEAEQHLVLFELLLANRKIKIPKSAVTTSKTHYVVYFLFDKAGNRSEMSFPKSVSVALGELPSGLQPCTVPLAADGLIDRADAATSTGPTRVHIEQYTGWHRDDGIVIKWHDQEVRTTVGAHESFPLRIPMPWAILSQTYDFTTGGDQTVEVDYGVLRGDYPTASPGSIDVKQNFEIPGPENPGPEPINDDLDLIRFESFSDSSTELTEDDIGEDATGYITLYDDVLEDDVLTLFYNGQAISPSYTVNATDSAGDEIPITIRWSVIEQTPVMDELPMYYKVTRPNVPNPQESGRTKINVVVERVDLPEPIRPGNPINCTHLIQKNGEWGVNVKIPVSDYLKEGATVLAVWNSFKVDNTTELPDTSFVEELSVSFEEEQNGIDWFIPYERCLKPTYGGSTDSAGRGKFAYGINIRGNTVASDVVSALIGVFENGGHCEIPRP